MILIAVDNVRMYIDKVKKMLTSAKPTGIIFFLEYKRIICNDNTANINNIRLYPLAIRQKTKYGHGQLVQ